MDFLPFPEETRFPGFVRAHHRSLFPQLPGQSRFNRRARRLWPRVEALRRHWAEALGATRTSLYLPDTKPLPVIGYKRAKGRSDFAATADSGVCASRHLKYFGCKRVLPCTSAGVPAACDLVPASTDERVAGEQVPDWVWRARILGDKGFIGADWQLGCRETRGLEIPTPSRANPRTAQPAGFRPWLHRLRERIEGAFHEVRNTGRHPGTRPAGRSGAAHACRSQDGQPCPWLLLRRQAGIDVRTFTVAG